MESFSCGYFTRQTSRGFCEFVEFDCVKYLMKGIRESFPNVMALSYGKEKESYITKEYKKDYDGYIFAELFRYGTKNDYDKTIKKIKPGNNVSFTYVFRNDDLMNQVFLKMQELVAEYGNGHYITYIDDTSKLYLSKKMIT